MNNFTGGEQAFGTTYYVGMSEKRYDETVGGRIHWARKNKGLTLGDVAGRMGIRSSHLSGVESNKVNLSLPKLAALLDILDVSADWLLGRPDVGPDGARKEAAGLSEDAERVAELVDLLPAWRRQELLQWLEGVVQISDAARREAREATESRPSWAGFFVADEYSLTVKLVLDLHVDTC